MKVVITVSGRFARLGALLARSRARQGGRGSFIVKGVNRGRMIVRRYNVKGIGDTVKTIRVVSGCRPSLIVSSNITKNTSVGLGIARIIMTASYMCRSTCYNSRYRCKRVLNVPTLFGAPGRCMRGTLTVGTRPSGRRPGVRTKRVMDKR